MLTAEERIESLEKDLQLLTKSVQVLISGIGDLVLMHSKLREDVSAIVTDIEADGNAVMIEIRDMREYLVKLAKFIQFADIRTTALATVVCRSLGVSPDDIAETAVAITQDIGSVDRLIKETKEIPKQP